MYLKASRAKLSTTYIAHKASGSSCRTRRWLSSHRWTGCARGSSAAKICLLAAFLVFWEAFGQESPSAPTGNKCNFIKVIEGFYIVLINIKVTLLNSFHHFKKIWRLRWYSSSFFNGFLSLNFLPFVPTPGNMDPNTSSTILLTAYVAHHCFWTLVKLH